MPMILQFILGVYLKLHIHERTIRPYFVIVHGLMGKIWPILGWIQVPRHLSSSLLSFTIGCLSGDIWCGNAWWLLFRRWVEPVPRSLYYGLRLHSIRNSFSHCSPRRVRMDTKHRKKPGMVR